MGDEELCPCVPFSRRNPWMEIHKGHKKRPPWKTTEKLLVVYHLERIDGATPISLGYIMAPRILSPPNLGVETAIYFH